MDVKACQSDSQFVAKAMRNTFKLNLKKAQKKKKIAGNKLKPRVFGHGQSIFRCFVRLEIPVP